jgi:hypothetical protein
MRKGRGNLGDTERKRKKRREEKIMSGVLAWSTNGMEILEDVFGWMSRMM